MLEASLPSPPRALDTLLAGLPVVPRPASLMVRGLAEDSRLVNPGDLFLGLRGLRTSRADSYFGEACRRGASAALLEGLPEEYDHYSNIPVCFHPQLRHDVSRIAARFFDEPSKSLSVLGVTGTNGKSTVTHLIAQALDILQGPGTAAVLGSLGYGPLGALRATGMTTPGPVLVQQQLHELRFSGIRAVAMEVSSHALDQYRVDATHFAVATFTNLTRDHLDYHGDLQRYGEAKARLFSLPGVRAVVLNAADPFHTTLQRRIASAIPVLGYSLTPVRQLTCLAPYQHAISPTGILLEGQWEGRTWRLESRLLGRFNAENLLAALTNLVLLGHEVDVAASALSSAEGAPGRMQRVADPAERIHVLVDYAHTPDALEKVLTTLRGLQPTQLWCVFGCGGDRDPGKRPLMGAMAARYADVVVLTNDNPRSENPDDILSAIRVGVDGDVRCICEPDRGLAISYALHHAEPGAIVLIAGKGHETYQEQEGQCLPFSDTEWAARVLDGLVPC